MRSDTVFVRSPKASGFVTEPPKGGTVLVRHDLTSPAGVRVPVDDLDSRSLQLVLDMARDDEPPA